MILASGAAAADLGPWWNFALVFLVLFALSFFFSGTETAFFSLQKIDRRRIAEGTTATHRRIHALLQRRTELITTILMGNETVNVAISATTAGIVAVLMPTRPWLTIVVVTPLLVLLSEITPKVLAYRFNRRWVDIAVWPLSAVYVLLWAPRLVVAGVVTALARLAGVDGRLRIAGMGEEEFLVLLERGTEQGVVGEEEREIIEAVFELDDLPVSRLMTPQPDIFSLPVDTAWADLLDATRVANFSRVPIYEGSPDNVLGVLLVKDLLRHRRRPLATADELRALLLPPVFVPETKLANDMMKEMIRHRIHMAFVVDEHGTLMGLVSLDDLIIELVGELGDDPSEELAQLITTGDDGSLTVRAGVDLDDFSEETGIVLPEGEYHTVGGFVFHTLGRIPAVGDGVVASNHRFEVTRMEGRRLVELKVSVHAPADQEASA